MKIEKLGALLVSAALCAGMAAPAFAFEGEAAPVEQPVLPEVVEEDVVTVTDETSGALTPEGNLTLVDDYHTNYSDGSASTPKNVAAYFVTLLPPVCSEPDAATSSAAFLASSSAFSLSCSACAAASFSAV